MSSAQIQISDQRTSFSPRETITGTATWQLDAPPRIAELRLVWSTTGRGITDFGIVETIPFASPQFAETRAFTITLPEGPYSFSGTLITLAWTLELELQPGNASDTAAIIVGPGGKPVTLPSIRSA